MDKLTPHQFINLLITAFPAIKEEVLDEDYEGLITLQVGCFTRFTQLAIDNNNDKLIAKCLAFVARYIDKVEFSIENSLTISWLGKLNFDNNIHIYSLLSAELKDRYTTIQQYYDAPLNQKVKEFLDDINKYN